MNQALALQAVGPISSLVQRHLPFLREIVTERLEVQIKENWSHKKDKPGTLVFCFEMQRKHNASILQK